MLRNTIVLIILSVGLVCGSAQASLVGDDIEAMFTGASGYDIASQLSPSPATVGAGIEFTG